MSIVFLVKCVNWALRHLGLAHISIKLLWLPFLVHETKVLHGASQGKLFSSVTVLSDSVRPHRQQPTRLLCPQDSLGKSTGVGCRFPSPPNVLGCCMEGPPSG